MPVSLIALSDLHLGYDCCVLNDPSVQDRVVGEIADLCSGAADRLILNGDCFEACVPKDAGTHDPAGFSPLMASTARSFLQKFTSKIKTTSLVLLWGNHDYTMWSRLATSCGTPTFTNNQKGDILLQHDGCILPGAESFLADVIGPASSNFQRIRSAYPNYVLGKNWPYLVFHHGHLLDKLILGWLPDIDYLALKVLIGAGMPKVDQEMDMFALHNATEAFISAMWKFNSKPRAEEWAILRRTEKVHKCPYYPISDADSGIVGDEVQGNQLGEQAQWYVETLMVTTLSAKADSFSDQSRVALEIRWPHPGQESACENVSRRVLVSMQGQPAVRTGVPSFGQCLGHYGATPGAFLGSPCRIHNHNFRAGSFGLAAEDVHETGPAGVGDCAGERVVLEHVGHAQAFHADHAVQPDQFQSYLVVMLVPQVTDAGVQNADTVRCLSSVAPALLLSRGRALQSAQRGKLGLEITRVFHAGGAVACGEEGFEPNVDAHGRQRAWWYHNVSQVAGQDYEPLVRLALETSHLDHALDWTVDLRADYANVLNSQAITVETDAVAVGRKLDAVKVITALEAWKARRLVALLAASEEVLIALVQAAQRGLSRREVDARLVRVRRSQLLELVGLRVVVEAQLARLVGEFALFESSVVEPPVCLQADPQLAHLVGAGIETKLEGPAHLLALLPFSVPSHACLGNGSARPRVVAATPQRRQPRTQRRKLGTQVVRRAALEAVHDLGHRTCGIQFKEQMHVVGHDFECVDRGVQFSGDLSQQLNQSLFYRSNKHRSPVLRTPYQVKLQGKDSTRVFGVSLDHMSIIHSPDTKSTTEGDGLPLPAKVGSPRPVN